MNLLPFERQHLASLAQSDAYDLVNDFSGGNFGNSREHLIVSPPNKRWSFPRKIWRRRPDLNRGWRFCRPLPYHLATAPIGGPTDDCVTG